MRNSWNYLILKLDRYVIPDLVNTNIMEISISSEKYASFMYRNQDEIKSRPSGVS